MAMTNFLRLGGSRLQRMPQLRAIRTLATKPDLSSIVHYAIYPAVGISRVGNSPEYFYANEVPGGIADPRVPLGNPDDPVRYKDSKGQVKRQAARFRVYGFDKNGNTVCEVTPDVGEVEWTVHIANRKASWYDFKMALDLVDSTGKSIAPDSMQRNLAFRRNASSLPLTIDPGPCTIKGRNTVGPPLEGTFITDKVYLGNLHTDPDGRLVVVGGKGVAKASTKYGGKLTTFANNDGWYDDVSDGTVHGRIKLKGSTEWVTVQDPAVVVCTPPALAPGLTTPTTMYDLVENVYLNKLGAYNVAPPEKTSFKEHIWPIFQMMALTQYVSQGFNVLFGTGAASDFLSQKVFTKLSCNDNDSESGQFRLTLFTMFAVPGQFNGPERLPPFYGDAIDFQTKQQKVPREAVPVTPAQYGHLQRWALGDFESDMDSSSWLGAPRLPETPSGEDPLQDVPLEEQTAALTKAALSEVLGGPFHPGIEITWIFRHPNMWQKPRPNFKGCPIRLKIDGPVIDDYGPRLTPEIALRDKNSPLQSSGPGSITRWMGVPWQSDAVSCLDGYSFAMPGSPLAGEYQTFLPLPTFWPARSLNEVLPEFAFARANHSDMSVIQRNKYLQFRKPWLRDLGVDGPAGDYYATLENMAERWDKLGVVAPRKTSAAVRKLGYPEVMHVETEREEAYEQEDYTRHLVQKVESLTN